MGLKTNFWISSIRGNGNKLASLKSDEYSLNDIVIATNEMMQELNRATDFLMDVKMNGSTSVGKKIRGFAAQKIAGHYVNSIKAYGQDLADMIHRGPQMSKEDSKVFRDVARTLNDHFITFSNIEGEGCTVNGTQVSHVLNHLNQVISVKTRDEKYEALMDELWRSISKDGFDGQDFG
ncbi:MAG: hypothetical protein ACRBDI_00600 [Alphaproteobacteria bacterium]